MKKITYCMSMVETSEQIDVNNDKGLLKRITLRGSGPKVPKGSVLRVKYTAYLLDGTYLDSSDNHEDPFQFTQGTGYVLRGLDEGVLTMQAGERAQFICSPMYAYGDIGYGDLIKPDTPIKLDVLVLDWDPEDFSPKRNGGILRHVIDSGFGCDSPKSSAPVDVTLVGECNGEKFCDKRITFVLGEGYLQDIPKGIEKCLKKMLCGERSEIILKPEFGFGSEGNERLGIPPRATVTYIVTLHSFEVVKEWWVMDSSEKLQKAEEFLVKGRSLYAEKRYALSIIPWKKQLRFIESSAGFFGAEEEQRKKLLLSCYLNLALAYLKIEDKINARHFSAKALEIDSNNIKAYYRRGQAQLMSNEPKMALLDFERVLELDPENKALILSLIKTCKLKEAEIKKEQKMIYSSMFDKGTQNAKKEEEAKKEEDVLAKVGEWGISERGHQPTDFERENPNILMLDKDGDFKDM